ncbi:hypothetical protein X798_06109, partial [Onchocerca flexuosa]
GWSFGNCRIFPVEVFKNFLNGSIKCLSNCLGQQLAFNPSNSKLEISLAFFQQDVENIMKAYSLLAGFCKTAWVCLVRCKTARLSGCFYFGAFRGRRLLPSLRE